MLRVLNFFNCCCICIWVFAHLKIFQNMIKLARDRNYYIGSINFCSASMLYARKRFELIRNTLKSWILMLCSLCLHISKEIFEFCCQNHVLIKNKSTVLLNRIFQILCKCITPSIWSKNLWNQGFSKVFSDFGFSWIGLWSIFCSNWY